jgi:predicted AAA+ superfamily ATPase
MYENLLERNQKFIQDIKCYRSYDSELLQLIKVLNNKKIATISGLRHTGKTNLVFTLLQKTQSFESSFYYNSELDTLWTVKTHEDFIVLFDLYVRIHGIPKIIILQNTNNIEWIKTLISKLYSTKKYKIIIVWNNIKIEWVTDIEIYPLWMSQNIEESLYGWIAEVRIPKDNHYKDFLLSTLKHDILSRDILESYNIKNISLFYSVIWYLAQTPWYYSLREIHRNLADHNIDVSLITMIEYINAALTTKFLSKCERYDIKNDNIISSKAQYFFGDVWLRKSFSWDMIDLRENLIYIELLRKWYNVTWWINGRFTFEFYAKKWGKTISLSIDNSSDKLEIRKTARKLAKLWDNSQKYVIVQNKNSLTMRKFEESWVKIIEIWELIEII